MKQKIVLAGGSGFIGQYLSERFREDGFEVQIISRTAPYIIWADEEAVQRALEGASVLINLAGKSVDCRYTKENRKRILESRVTTTKRLQAILEKCTNPPELWINSSTATIYRHAEDRPMDEDTGILGSGFSVEVARAWEAAFFESPLSKTRKLALRIAIVLGKNGGVMRPYTNMARWGLGGAQGSGHQLFSWIHVEDLYQIIRFAMLHKDMGGIYNASAPLPVSNHQFMQWLRHFIRPLFYFPSPRWLLAIGAWLIGTETELLFKSRWVIPDRLLKKGYSFSYPTIQSALCNILGRK